jgi:hypothetical protein
MAYTQTQIDALRAAIASGLLTVRHGDTSTTYQSLKEMREVLREMEAEVGGSPRPRRTVAAFGNGC